MKTLLMTGAGSVINGWEPVRLAIREVAGPHAEAEPNLLFATLVHQLRWLHLQKESEKNDRASREGLDALYQQKLKTLRRLQSAICERLAEAEGSGALRLRAEFSELRPLIPAGSSIITTNWDLSGMAAGTDGPIAFLHGNRKLPEGLYLPTEAIDEPFREDRARVYLGQVTNAALKMVEQAERLVVYGLAFSPLDPELGVVVSDGMRIPGSDELNLKEIVVVDTDPTAVTRRLKFFLGGDADRIRFHEVAINSAKGRPAEDIREGVERVLR